MEIHARAQLAEPLGQDLGVPVIVENKPGASQTIGAAEVARSASDGYTFMFSIADPLVGALATVKSLPYNPRKDFTFVTKVDVDRNIDFGTIDFALYDATLKLTRELRRCLEKTLFCFSRAAILLGAARQGRRAAPNKEEASSIPA